MVKRFILYIALYVKFKYIVFGYVLEKLILKV